MNRTLLISGAVLLWLSDAHAELKCESRFLIERCEESCQGKAGSFDACLLLCMNLPKGDLKCDPAEARCGELCIDFSLDSDCYLGKRDREICLQGQLPEREQARCRHVCPAGDSPCIAFCDRLQKDLKGSQPKTKDPAKDLPALPELEQSEEESAPSKDACMKDSEGVSCFASCQGNRSQTSCLAECFPKILGDDRCSLVELPLEGQNRCIGLCSDVDFDDGCFGRTGQLQRCSKLDFKEEECLKSCAPKDRVCEDFCKQIDRGVRLSELRNVPRASDPKALRECASKGSEESACLEEWLKSKGYQGGLRGDCFEHCFEQTLDSQACAQYCKDARFEPPRKECTEECVSVYGDLHHCKKLCARSRSHR